MILDPTSQESKTHASPDGPEKGALKSAAPALTDLNRKTRGSQKIKI